MENTAKTTKTLKGQTIKVLGTSGNFNNLKGIVRNITTQASSFYTDGIKTGTARFNGTDVKVTWLPSPGVWVNA